MKSKHNFKSVISVILTLVMVLGTLPAISVSAAQKSDYDDPADHWLTTNNRTNEFDINATVTYETQYCSECDKDTTVMTYRVPEYTKSGQSALNRGVKYSDGTCINGIDQGNLDDGTPGKDATFTGYHWTKAICQTCGTINTIDGSEAYSFNNNVYNLNSCDHNFFLEFDNTTHEEYDELQHTSVLKKGTYCQFCKGTYAQATSKKEAHHLKHMVDGQLGNNRFFLQEECSDCGYKTSEYVAAKAVVSSYYGNADGEAHSVRVSDLSDDEVHARIRYGTTAENCSLTSAPSYTKAGYYPVYYEIDYQFDGEIMTENGVSYVWLLENNTEQSGSGGSGNIPHVHDYRYIETVKPTCSELGFERWQCNGCGSLMKQNYAQALGHSYKSTTVREATCKKGGLELAICTRCGDFHEHSTEKADHEYVDERVAPTCKSAGYTKHSCNVCGQEYVTDITSVVPHTFESYTKAPTCTQKGYTTYICSMCRISYTDDYTDALGHKWDEGHVVTGSTCVSDGVTEFHCKNCDEKMIQAESAKGHTPGVAATCTTPQLCEDCGAILELPKEHSYEQKVVEPTCTTLGYTIYSCKNCVAEYTADYTDKIQHEYEITVVPPTCTEMGHSVYKCKHCDDMFLADYTDKLPHHYQTEVTAPTCTSMGFTKYTCADCDESYIGNYTDMLEHNYNQQVIPPTCTEHGYTIYTCPDCQKEYIGDLTDCEQHHYSEKVVAPTCTEMGYTVFTCDSCGDSYKGNYTDLIEHQYAKTVTNPTCSEMGYTDYVCEVCGHSRKGDYTDALGHEYGETITAPTCTELGFTTYVCSRCNDTYKGNFVEAYGHTPSDWIIDIPATIEHAGEKHIECTVCGNVLQTVDIPQLIDTDNSDEDGKAQVGAFSIILTDKNGKPVFDSEITIDVNDNVTIKLPDGRLLDFADQTTITAFYTDTQEPKADLQIFIYDGNNNAATGVTDANGQLKVPNNQSSTGDDNGTIGGGDEDNKFTYVVTITDKENIITENCDIWIGESNNIVVDLPDGVKPTREAPVIVTVTDHNGVAQKDVTVIAIGDADFMEKGKTDIYGKVTLPVTNEGYTDENGKVNVDNLNVIVNDETGLIPNAYVIHNEDGTLSVTLPQDKAISYANRTTVTVLDSVGNPVRDKTVTVQDIAEMAYTAITDEYGRIVVPPLSEDMTDSEGKATVNGYHVLITDESKPIENAFVTIVDGKINVKLPEGELIDMDNRITAIVTDSEEKPVKDMSVTFTDSTEKTETNLTDENGRATVPPINIDYTDVNGYSEVDGYIVIVNNETGFVEKAFVKHTITPSEPDENGEVKNIEDISITLPENIKVGDYNNRVTVTVKNKADGTAVKDMGVIVTETKAAEAEETPKSANGVTDKNGKVTFPPLNEDITDDKGDSGIADEKPTENPDNPGETETVEYKVIVSDTKAVISNAFVSIKDSKISVKLPDTHTLTTSNQTTVTVLDKDGNPVKGVNVSITDKNNKTASKDTDTNGKVVLPVKSSGGGGGGGSRPSGGGGGGGSYVSNTVNVKITDKDGKNVTGFSKSTDSKGNVTITLPNGKTLENDYYTITVTDRYGKAKTGTTVTLKDKNKKEATGKTDKDGMLILPASEHKAYIVGYDDGTFRPDSDMSRAEAAAIFARLIAEAKGENISGKASFVDVKTNEWYSKYIGYLEKYNVIKGYSDKTFKPDAPVTRAEFVSMTVRYYSIFNDVKKLEYTVKYTDVSKNYWAYGDIAYAKQIGWLNGYADGTFRGDNNITRAEVVTVVNRATGRKADESYISKNLSMLNKFTDLKNNSHWGWADIMEAANDHMAVSGTDGETWVK